MRVPFARRAALPILLLLIATGPVEGVSRSSSATAVVSVAALAKLSLSATTITFPDANPDIVPLVSSTGGPITITAKARTSPGSTVSLSVLASDDLRAGVSTIPASAVTWTATGTGFVAGTMSTVVAQSVAVWVSSGSRVGTQSYRLANSWTYATGSYSTTFTYTLTAP